MDLDAECRNVSLEAGDPRAFRFDIVTRAPLAVCGVPYPIHHNVDEFVGAHIHMIAMPFALYLVVRLSRCSERGIYVISGRVHSDGVIMREPPDDCTDVDY